MLTYENLYYAPVDALSQAVDDWTVLMKKLQGLSEEFDRTVIGPLRASGWQGKDADAGFVYIRKIAKEFDDAVVEATGIRDLLQEAYELLKRNQDELYRIAADVLPKEQLVAVLDSAGETKPQPPVDPFDKTTWRGQDDIMDTYELIADARRRVGLQIRELLADAEQAGETAAWGLRANMGGGPRNFSAKAHNSLDEAWRHRMATYQVNDASSELEAKILEAVHANSVLLTKPQKAAAIRALVEAERAVEDRFGEDSDGTVANSFKHAYWSAQLTRDLGPNLAERITTMHEIAPDSGRSGELLESMDLYNNEVGRDIGSQNRWLGNAALADKVEQAVRSGQTVALDTDKERVLPSDQI